MDDTCDEEDRGLAGQITMTLLDAPPYVQLFPSWLAVVDDLLDPPQSPNNLQQCVSFYYFLLRMQSEWQWTQRSGGKMTKLMSGVVVKRSFCTHIDDYEAINEA